MKLLHEKETLLLKAGKKELDRELQLVQSEIEAVQDQIRVGLAQRILSFASIIDHGLQRVARLDVLFAKAAFGIQLNGVFPKISNEGKILVEDFVHPVLAIRDKPPNLPGNSERDAAVPIDLYLSSNDVGRALIISGPNGGGKTLAMKSFGIVCILCKLGIPVPVSHGVTSARVDFVDHILVAVGDQQSVVQGESTLTAKLNACASIISRVSTKEECSSPTFLVLLDELGSGTDIEAGGAIAQAILEHLLSIETCLVVATTHSQRLKVLSYKSPDIACASVLLKRDDTCDYRLPTFQLEYGSIGDSYAMGAASRCKPALPETVLSRAAALLESGTAESEGGRLGFYGDYILALTSSMERQVERAEQAAEKAEAMAEDSAKCRTAMISLASAYETHLAQLEQRLLQCFNSLKGQQDRDDLQLIGDTLSELRVVKKKIISQKEMLRERGLKLLPESYELQVGESVTIVTEGEWEGITAKVVADSVHNTTLGPRQVLVELPMSLDPWDNNMDDASLLPGRAAVSIKFNNVRVFERHELAMWDYDSVWDYNMDDTSSSAKSIPDSKRKLSSLLSTLKTLSSGGPSGVATTKKSFTSSRQRKAAGKKSNKKGRKKP